MEDQDIHKHISELYLQYEHLKKEIKRDREEMYQLQMKQLVELSRQNKLLRDEIKSYTDIKEVKEFFTTFIKNMSFIIPAKKKKKPKLKRIHDKT